ncbi:MAG: hypothetical protein K6E20_05400 [Acholeplasmatales bacterium]|nr:hypothetical protein [Acholeplasmatales bacterium]
MKKHKILGIILIAILLLFTFNVGVSSQISTNYSTTSCETVTVLNAETQESSNTSDENKKEEATKTKNHGKAVMVFLLVGIPGILFLALGGYSFVMGIIQKKKDYMFYGPQLIFSHCAFALTCGIQGFKSNYIYIPIVFTIITLLFSIFGLKDAKLDLNAQVASKKSTKKPFLKIVLSLAALVAIIIALAMETTKDKTLDSEFVGAFFLAIVVLINAFDAGKSLSKFLGSSNL